MEMALEFLQLIIFDCARARSASQSKSLQLYSSHTEHKYSIRKVADFPAPKINIFFIKFIFYHEVYRDQIKLKTIQLLQPLYDFRRILIHAFAIAVILNCKAENMVETEEFYAVFFPTRLKIYEKNDYFVKFCKEKLPLKVYLQIAKIYGYN
jgi:hypothetical protein